MRGFEKGRLPLAEWRSYPAGPDHEQPVLGVLLPHELTVLRALNP